MTTPVFRSKTLRALLLGSVTLAFSGPVQAGSSTIEERLIELQQEIELLKTEREKRPAPANAVTGGDFPGSFKLPGTNTSISIGGEVKADVIGSLDHDLGDTFLVGAIPQDGAPSNGSTRFHARQSRLDIAASTPTRLGDANLVISGDFFGEGGNEAFSNSSPFVIREAYGELGPVLVGQTWTLFMPLASFPETVDYHGPAGIPFIRQAQLRYTHDLGNGLFVAGSLENPELFAFDFEGTGIGSGDDVGVDKLPDVIGAVEYNGATGLHLKFSGVARMLSVEDVQLADGRTTDDEEFGWGLMAAAAIPVTPATILTANFTYGDGIGRYLFGAFESAADAFLDEDGNLNSIETWGFAGGLRHAWSDAFTSSFVYGRHEVEDTFFSESDDVLQSFHVNTWWTATETVRFGLEYIHGRRDFVDSSLDNTANRIQFGAQFFF